MIEVSSNKCPVCGSNGICIRSLKKMSILQELEQYFNEKLPEKLEVIDYEIIQCKNCSLEYAFPLQPGSQSFYQWITTRPGYYPQSRWEWLAILEHIKQREETDFTSILEIGCGVGDFLDMAQKLSNIHVVGIDTTFESVHHCRNKGLEAHCETIESFQKKLIPSQKFDYVVSFHCLEHVSDPKNLLESMLSVLKPGGSIFMSTPYSPMSFEEGWFDIMNHPPHHMTRWNQKAYDEIARQVGCNVKYLMPSASSALRRALNTFKLANFRRNQLVPKHKLIQILVLKLVQFVKLFYRQFLRETINGKTTADVILVEFTIS